MSFHSWLQNLRSVLVPRRGQHHHGRRSSLRAATRRLNLEALENRWLLSFSPATSFPVGPNPQAMVAGDFNHDGHLDLATANLDNGTVSVLLGDGNGGFGAAIDSYAGGSPAANRASLAVADFNKDGHLDLAVTFHEPFETGSLWSSVNVLLSNGDGTFRSPIYYTGGNGMPLAVAVGDFNNDGNSDLVLTECNTEWGYTLAEVLLGNGRGGFTIPYGGYPGIAIAGAQYALAVGDLNGDGNLDVVTISEEVGNELLGNGDGTFRSSQELGAGAAVAVGDFTRDGIPDLVVADGAISVGRGDGTFDDPIGFSAGGTGVAVADFNGDGKLDAVTSDGGYPGTVSELLGNGDGTLTDAGAYAVGVSPGAVAVGDFNGDGRPDVSAANAGTSTVAVLLNDGTWTPPPPSLRINDVTVSEGNSSAVAATFKASLSFASNVDVAVHYTTADVGATAGSDYLAASGDVIIPAGQSSATVTVAVKGDRLAETNETFAVNLSGATNATIADGQGVGTILDDEPRISIQDATVNEGHTGTRPITLTVSLSTAYDVPVTISYATANGTAAAGSDYQAASGTLTIPAGQTSGTITVQVSGDRLAEPNETLFVNLSNPTYGVVSDGQGLATILDDEPRISISDLTAAEGKNGKTLFTFTVTLSAAYDQPVTMSYKTVDGTATASGDDYVANSGTLTFKPGETSKIITIEVKGDTKKEANETFYLDLSDNSGNSLITKKRGIGTILNDD